MPNDYKVLIALAVFGIGVGLFLYRAAKLRRMKVNQIKSSSYEEVQRMVDLRVKWAAVAATIIAILGFVACYLAK